MVSALPCPHAAGASRPRRGGLHTPRPLLDFDALLSVAAPDARGAWLHWLELLTDAQRDAVTALSIEPDASCWRLHSRSCRGLEERRLDGDVPARILDLLHDAAGGQPGPVYIGTRLDAADYVLGVHLLDTPHGQAMHIELHPDEPLPATLDMLGMPAPVQRQLRRLLAESRGWLLVGSDEPAARTALLHALVQAISSPERRVLSLEPGVHHRLPRTTQLVLSPPLPDLSGEPARVLPETTSDWHAALRMEHDVVVLGDMPARLDVAALGPRAISDTLVVQACSLAASRHAGNWLEAQGFTPAWIDGTVLGLLRQARARRLCQACRHPAPVGDDLLRWLHQALESGHLMFDQWLGAIDRDRFSVAPGCAACHGRGFVGTVNLFTLDAGCRYVATDGGGRRQTIRYRQVLEPALCGEITLADAAAIYNSWYGG